MIGIAIINYKTFQKTIECINSIRNTIKLEYKIYLLENGSNNGSAEILQSIYFDSEDVELIISDKNHGYARGNNLCIIRMIEDGCETAIISNNDIICKGDVIEKLLNDLSKNKDYLLIGPKIVSPEGEFQKSVKMKKYKNFEYLKKSTYLANFFKSEITKEKKEIEMLNQLTEVFWVSGAFFACNLAKMKDIGLFDKNTFLFFEEYILAEKAFSKGYKLGYDPNAVVVHYHAVSTGGGLNIVSKKIADQSEMYYFHAYANKSKMFIFIVKMIRSLEVIYTFGGKKIGRVLSIILQKGNKEGETECIIH